VGSQPGQGEVHQSWCLKSDHDATTTAAYKSGKSARGVYRVIISLQNGWTVEIYGAVATGRLLANATAVGLLLAGIALSLLPAAFGICAGDGAGASVAAGQR
jgi:hypothetical protein